MTVEKTIIVNSLDFEPFGRIPDRFTCEDQDVNPTLMISQIPEGTKSLALILDDVDAITPTGPFVHWLIWNLKPTYTTIGDNSVPEGAIQGINTGGKIGYMGPCPPPTQPHRYRFAVYALSEMLALAEGADRFALDKAMEGKILGRGELIGEYSRQSS